MPLVKPRIDASDEEWAIYLAKKGATIKKKQEHRVYEGKRGVYVRDNKHKKLQRRVQRQRFPGRFKRKIPPCYLVGVDILRQCCEDVTGVSPLLTIRITPGEPKEVRNARRLEWYIIRVFAKKKPKWIEEYYGLNWWDVAKHLAKYKEISQMKGKIRLNYQRIKDQIEQASETPRAIKKMQAPIRKKKT